MFNYPWVKKETVINGTTMIEWVGGRNNDLVFLNSDAALAFEIDHIDPESGKPCNRWGGRDPARFCKNRDGTDVPGCIQCPDLNNAYGTVTREYDQNQAKWLSDFSGAFQKMVDSFVPCAGGGKVRLVAPE
jgi:hypothetical protein